MAPGHSNLRWTFKLPCSSGCASPRLPLSRPEISRLLHSPPHARSCSTLLSIVQGQTNCIREATPHLSPFPFPRSLSRRWLTVRAKLLGATSRRCVTFPLMVRSRHSSIERSGTPAGINAEMTADAIATFHASVPIENPYHVNEQQSEHPPSTKCLPTSTLLYHSFFSPEEPAHSHRPLW